MASRKKKIEDSLGWPKIEKGSHLTVITHEDGRVEMIWDDEALSRDVKNAILAYESAAGEKPKAVRKKTKS